MYTSFFVSLPYGFILWILHTFSNLSLFFVFIIYIIGFIGTTILLYFPLKQFSSIIDFLNNIEDVPEIKLPSIIILPEEARLSLALNNVSRVIKTTSDVSQRISSELDVLLDKIPMPLIQINSDRRVVRQNAAAIDLLGEASLGKDLVIVLRHPQVISEVDKVIERKKSSEIEVSIGDKVKKSYLCYLVCSEEYNDSNAILIVFSDITDVIKGEQMRVDFVANASHEIRTPLTVLSGCLETLSGAAKGDLEAENKFLELAKNETTRMTSLVDDLLSLSEIEINQHSSPSEEVDIALVIENSVSSLKSSFSIGDSKTNISLNIPKQLPPVLGDELELDLLWRNLILNAVKYGDGRVEIEVSLVSDSASHNISGECIKVDIIDYGCGIEAIHLPRLTERFYRVDTVRSRKLGGTGLGLAIVKHIITRHHGFLEIKSELNKGSSFSVLIPVIKST